MIVKDLVPHIDQAYRTIADRSARVLEGISMGGFGSLYLGFKYPETFGIISSWSNPFYDRTLWDLAPDAADKLRGKTYLRLICGTKDSLFREAKAYHRWLERLNIPHEFMWIEGAGHGIPNSMLNEERLIEFFAKALDKHNDRRPK